MIDRKVSQNYQILNHLKSDSITSYDAIKKYGCLRLAARIKDLRNRGYDIITQTTHKNGKTFATYSLIDG